MQNSIISSPHVPRVNRVNRIMLDVLLALVPGMLAMTWFFGWGLLINLVLAVTFAVVAEAAVMLARGRSPPSCWSSSSMAAWATTPSTRRWRPMSSC